MYNSTMQKIASLERDELRLDIYQGIDDEFIRQLLQVTSTDLAISKHTPDDLERYPALEVAKEHLASRYPYILVNQANSELAGIVWFNKRDWTIEEESPSHTFAIRIYEGYRGKGLSEEFAKITTEHFMESNSDVSGLWLTTDVNNLPAIRLYVHNGWWKHSETDGRITMIYTLD